MHNNRPDFYPMMLKDLSGGYTVDLGCDVQGAFQGTVMKIRVSAPAAVTSSAYEKPTVIKLQQLFRLPSVSIEGSPSTHKIGT